MPRLWNKQISANETYIKKAGNHQDVYKRQVPVLGGSGSERPAWDRDPVAADSGSGWGFRAGGLACTAGQKMRDLSGRKQTGGGQGI